MIFIFPQLIYFDYTTKYYLFLCEKSLQKPSEVKKIHILLIFVLKKNDFKLI